MLEYNKRIHFEKLTVETMIKIYCKRHHKTITSLCEDCRELLAYSTMRLDNCKFKGKKPVCGRCKVHCYKTEMRDMIRNVMRFSGPRMLFSHPIMTFYHIYYSLTLK